MDPFALEALEFPAIAERVAHAAATEHGAGLARALVPSPDPEDVARRQALTAEVIALLDIAAEPPLEGIEDVREQAALAARGGALAPKALRSAGNTISGALLDVAALEDQDALPCARHVARRHQPVVPGADDDRVVARSARH